MLDDYENIEEYNLGKKRKVFKVFDGMLADMINSKNINPEITELLGTGRKLNISIVFITQPCFKVQRAVRSNTTHFFYFQNSKNCTN